jgi:hypothetical protein
MKRSLKNNLDEMLDQKLLKLEEYGFWIVFWALVCAIVIQLIIGGSIKEVLGEIIVLLIGSIYIAVTTLKNGLWTRTSTPTRKGNALASIIPTVLIGTIHIFKMIQSNKIETKSLLITAAIAVAVYVGCFVILEVLRLAYDKRRAALDDIDEKESEE